MKGILEFDLNVIEEEERFHLAAHAIDWYLVVLKLDAMLRGKVKYRKLPQRARQEVDEIRGILRDLMIEHGISLEDIS